jgi:hypothetical protein
LDFPRVPVHARQLGEGLVPLGQLGVGGAGRVWLVSLTAVIGELLVGVDERQCPSVELTQGLVAFLLGAFGPALLDVDVLPQLDSEVLAALFLECAYAVEFGLVLVDVGGRRRP